MSIESFESRKRDHLRHSLDSANQAEGLGGLSRVHLVHEALPDLDFDEIVLTTRCLGQQVKTPFYVAGMTAGHPDAAAINLALAQACSRRGWAMGVGSQRRELEAIGSGRREDRDASAQLDRWVEIRSKYPELILFANLGVSQVIGAPLNAVRAVVESTQAQALFIHLNALQEVIQPEGTPRFKGGLEAIRRLAGELGVPVAVKETGCGMSRSTLLRLKSTGVAAVDVSGLGGTHWGRIEGARAPGKSMQAGAAETFASWGEPTVDSVRAAAEVFGSSGPEVWASGGVRSGLDSAKLIALGAGRVGYAQPALRAAVEASKSESESEQALDRWMERQEFELKTALFCTGARTPDELRGKEGVWTIKPS